MDIEQRLARLERANRIYRNLFIFAGVCIVALVSYGATKPIPDVIQARGFEVINKEGREVVELSAWKFGGRIDTYPATGIYLPSVSISHTDNGGGFLTIRNKNGKELIREGADKGGNGLLMIQDRNGKELIYAGASKSGHGGLININNKTGETVVQLEVDEHGNGVVGAYDRKGVGRTLHPGP